MNIIVVYKGIGKIAADQLKKLVSYKDDTDANNIVGTEDGSVEVIAMEECVYRDSAKTGELQDKVLFIDDVKGAKDIKLIAQPLFEKNGVAYGVAGPQAVLTVDTKMIRKEKDYEAFLGELNELTYQKIKEAPQGFKEKLVDFIEHGIWGMKTRQDNLKKQQLIYGITKFYYQDLRTFLED